MNKKRRRKSNRSDPLLKRWYRRYNKLLFGGRLPSRTTKITWAYGPGFKGLMGQFQPQTDGTNKILIAWNIRHLGRVAKLTIIHEMSHEEVHVRGFHNEPEHGPKWQAVMRRHAVAGHLKDLW